MNIEQLWNRATNLVAVSIVAIAGFAFAPDYFGESEIPNKVDEALLFLLALAAIFWYRRGANRFARSLVPVLMVWGALIIKIGAIFVEFSTKDDLADDFGALVLFVIASLFVSWLYSRKAPAA